MVARFAGVVLAFALAGFGFAEAREVRVETRGYNLYDVRSVAELHDAVVDAAVRACREPGRLTLEMRRAEQQCRRTAIANAVESANIETLTAVHNGLGEQRFARGAPRRLDETIVAAFEEAANRMNAQRTRLAGVNGSVNQ